MLIKAKLASSVQLIKINANLAIMNIFDIIGPVMIGPSSSHTAGAVRMGNLTRELLQDGSTPAAVSILMHGSFARTAKGHGTDRAIIAGLLGYRPDDDRITGSFEAAEKAGMKFSFTEADLGKVHPNTAQIIATDKQDKKLNLQFSSVGGGKIILNEIDGVKVRYEGKYPTLIVFNEDVPGVVVSVGRIIADEEINIVEMRVYNDENKSNNAVMIINMNKRVSADFIEKCKSVPEIKKIIYLDKLY